MKTSTLSYTKIPLYVGTSVNLAYLEDIIGIIMLES